MVIEDYDKPLRSPVSRSNSSTSLKDQLSPDLIREVKLYPKMSHGERPQPRRQPHRTNRRRAADAPKKYVHTSFCFNHSSEISRLCAFIKLSLCCWLA